MRTLMVTGTAGFIGYRFGQLMTQAGHSVIAVDLQSHFDSRRRQFHEHEDWTPPNLLDREKLLAALHQDGELSPSLSLPKLDAIIHLGACANTLETRKDYLNHHNLISSQKLWNLATRLKIPFVYASSAATYGEGELGYSDSEDLIPKLKPLNLYGQSKQDFDLWALSQERQGNCPPAWSGFKFFNVYGFGEAHKGAMASVIYHWVQQIKAGGAVRLFRSHRPGIADGHQRRDFVSVEDVLKVLNFALTRPLKRGIYNLGTGKAETYLDLANAVFRALSKEPRIEFIDTPIAIRDKYQYFTQADLARLKAAGYSEPFLSLEDGVTRYVRRLELKNP